MFLFEGLPISVLVERNKANGSVLFINEPIKLEPIKLQITQEAISRSRIPHFLCFAAVSRFVLYHSFYILLGIKIHGMVIVHVMEIFLDWMIT